MSEAISESIAPSAVRMARSPPRDSATVMPVARPSRTATAPTSTPSLASESSMKVPAASRPTAATSATRRPSRAAATAVIEAEPPISRDIRSTSFSCWPKAGVTSSPSTSTSGLQSPITTRSKSGDDNVDPGVLEHVQGVVGDTGVGDQGIDLGGAADPGERPAAHLGAVRDDDHLARLAAHELVDARFSLVVRGRAGHGVDAVHAEDRHVERDLLEYAGGERPDQLIRLRPRHAAGGHDLDVLPDGELGRDVQRVGDDRERRRRRPRRRVAAGRQGACRLGGGGAAVQSDHLAWHDHAGRKRADALLLRHLPLRLVAQRQVVVDSLRDRAAPDPGEHLLAGQLIEVPADGGRGYVKRGRGILYLELPGRGQQLKQVIPPAIAAHQRLLPVHQCRRPARAGRPPLPTRYVNYVPPRAG